VPKSAPAPAPLRSKGGTVTKGMGRDPAYYFSLPKNATSSSGFLKLFVSTERLNLGRMNQPKSPFDPTFEPTGRLSMHLEPFVDIHKWDALRVVLTMTAD
jgi:hypothetical protein